MGRVARAGGGLGRQCRRVARAWGGYGWVGLRKGYGLDWGGTDGPKGLAYGVWPKGSGPRGQVCGSAAVGLPLRDQ